MYPDTAGYRPAQLAIIGIISYIVGLLLPVLNLDPHVGALLGSIGAWLLFAAYLLYAVTIYDLRATGTKLTAILMLAIPLAIYWDGGQFLRTLAENATAAAISLAIALVLGSLVSLALLWMLGTMRRGALSLLHRHERRRRWPSAAWVVVCVLAVSFYSISSTAVLPETVNPSGIIRSVSETFENAGSAPIPGISIPTVQQPAPPLTTAVRRQDSPTATNLVTSTPIASKTAAADLDAIEQAVFSYTNRERQQQGLPALQWDAALASVARAHSRDMVDNAFFSHTNLRGQDPTARAVAAGYPVRRDLGGLRYSIGIAENIDKMPTGNVVGHGFVSNDPQSIARAMVQAWMNSPGHRENIMHSQYARIGVGVAFDGTLYYFGTQDFI